MGAALQPNMTLQDYLTWENEQVERHEYWGGEVFAMVGGRRIHGRVVVNIASALMQALKGSPWQVFTESMKVQAGDDLMLYPDVFVTCDRADLRSEIIFKAPAVVIEVLSPSTQAYDRSRKFAAYRRIASLREYVLIDPDTRRVEAFRLGADGLWYLHDQSEADVLELSSLDCRIAMADIWDGADPPADD